MCAACSIISVLTQWGATLVINIREREIGLGRRHEHNTSTRHTQVASYRKSRRIYRITGGSTSGSSTLLISEVWGGFSPEAMRFLGELAQAPRGTTQRSRVDKR